MSCQIIPAISMTLDIYSNPHKSWGSQHISWEWLGFCLTLWCVMVSDVQWLIIVNKHTYKFGAPSMLILWCKCNIFILTDIHLAYLNVSQHLEKLDLLCPQNESEEPGIWRYKFLSTILFHAVTTNLTWDSLELLEIHPKNLSNTLWKPH